MAYSPMASFLAFAAVCLGLAKAWPGRDSISHGHDLNVDDIMVLQMVRPASDECSTPSIPLRARRIGSKSSSLVPSHHHVDFCAVVCRFGSQEGEAPFSLRVRADYYWPGQELRVEMERREGGPYFRGFALQAHRKDTGWELASVALILSLHLLSRHLLRA